MMDKVIYNNMTARELCGVDDTTALEIALQIKLEAALDVIWGMQAAGEALVEMGADYE